MNATDFNEREARALLDRFDVVGWNAGGESIGPDFTEAKNVFKTSEGYELPFLIVVGPHPLHECK